MPIKIIQKEYLQIQATNNYNSQMRYYRKIGRSYPPSIKFIQKKEGDQFIAKTYGDKWLQIHDKNTIMDVISVPPQLQYSTIYFCQIDQQGSRRYLFNKEQQVRTGVANNTQTEIETQKVDLGKISYLSNPIQCENKIFCISQVTESESFLNLLQMFIDKKKIISHQTVLTKKIATGSNISMGYQKSLLFTSEYQDFSTLNILDIQSQIIKSQYHLPDFLSRQKIKSFSLPIGSDSKCSMLSSLYCVYNPSHLIINDCRLNSPVICRRVRDCRSAFSKPEGGMKILYTQGSKLRQFDMRKWDRSLIQIIAHESEITECEIINRNVVKIEDSNTPFVYLYQILQQN